jgi:hypothetical protein
MGIWKDCDGQMFSRVSEFPFDQLNDYDQRLFPARRAGFLTERVGLADAVALAVVEDSCITGSRVLRACLAGDKIGPLFEDSELIAQELPGALALASGLTDYGRRSGG